MQCDSRDRDRVMVYVDGWESEDGRWESRSRETKVESWISLEGYHMIYAENKRKRRTGATWTNEV